MAAVNHFERKLAQKLLEPLSGVGPTYNHPTKYWAYCSDCFHNNAPTRYLTAILENGWLIAWWEKNIIYRISQGI